MRRHFTEKHTNSDTDILYVSGYGKERRMQMVFKMSFTVWLPMIYCGGRLCECVPNERVAAWYTLYTMDNPTLEVQHKQTHKHTIISTIPL